MHPFTRIEFSLQITYLLLLTVPIFFVMSVKKLKKTYFVITVLFTVKLLANNLGPININA